MLHTHNLVEERIELKPETQQYSIGSNTPNTWFSRKEDQTDARKHLIKWFICCTQAHTAHIFYLQSNMRTAPITMEQCYTWLNQLKHFSFASSNEHQNIFHKNREISILPMKKKPTARLTLLMSIRNMSLGFYLPEKGDWHLEKQFQSGQSQTKEPIQLKVVMTRQRREAERYLKWHEPSGKWKRKMLCRNRQPSFVPKRSVNRRRQTRKRNP